MKVTSFANFLVSDRKLKESIALVDKYKQMANGAEDPASVFVNISSAERKQLERALVIKASAVNGESGEIVPRAFRMCAFLPSNVPILCMFLLAPPTMFCTALSQWVNQSYMAGLNYANKNPSCEYTNMDLAQGYGAAVSASIVVAVALRLATAGLTKSATGLRLMVLNAFVGATASASAGYINTAFMRKAEIQKGIDVMSSPDLKPENVVGISSACARKAVRETALSRAALSAICVSAPAVMLVGLSRLRVIDALMKANKVAKVGIDAAAILLSLTCGLPLAIGIFEPVSKIEGKKCEEKFHKYKYLYFDKGL